MSDAFEVNNFRINLPPAAGFTAGSVGLGKSQLYAQVRIIDPTATQGNPSAQGTSAQAGAPEDEAPGDRAGRA